MGNEADRQKADDISRAFGGGNNNRRGTSRYAAGSTNLDNDGALRRLWDWLTGADNSSGSGRTGTAHSGSGSDEEGSDKRDLKIVWSDDSYNIDNRKVHKDDTAYATFEGGEDSILNDDNYIVNDNFFLSYEDPLGDIWVKVLPADYEGEPESKWIPAKEAGLTLKKWYD